MPGQIPQGGERVYCQFPLYSPIYAQLGVVGQYIDRYIRIAGFFYGAYCH